MTYEDPFAAAVLPVDRIEDAGRRGLTERALGGYQVGAGGCDLVKGYRVSMLVPLLIVRL